jgi:hypothetical protein
MCHIHVLVRESAGISRHGPSKLPKNTEEAWCSAVSQSLEMRPRANPDRMAAEEGQVLACSQLSRVAFWTAAALHIDRIPIVCVLTPGAEGRYYVRGRSCFASSVAGCSGIGFGVISVVSGSSVAR